MHLKGINRRTLSHALGLSLLSAPLISALPGRATASTSGRPWPFLIGADVSWIPQDEAQGAVYFDKGIQKDPLDILKDAGFNAIKLRLFVDPENGYSRHQPDKKWCGIYQTIAFARRIKAAGMHLSLTLHYSDTWADPEHQNLPAAWKDFSVTQLTDAVYKHTHDSLLAMKAADVAPDLVLIGNETTFGMLWPHGRVPLTIPTGNPVTDANHMKVDAAGGFDNFATLLKAGLSACGDTVPTAKTAVHNHLGRHWPIVENWIDNLLKRDVRFDATGFSCYQQAQEGDWERTFREYAKRYPDLGFFVAEYSSRKTYVNEITHAHPSGWGAYIWEPTRHQEAVFDKDGENAGEGPRPNLISQGLNAAEAPGSTPATDAPQRWRSPGGRYDSNAFLDTYRQMARIYR